MGGILRVLRRLPTLIAGPTTAGTGSETALAAVITNPATHRKYALMSFPRILRYAVLDAELTYTLPASALWERQATKNPRTSCINAGGGPVAEAGGGGFGRVWDEGGQGERRSLPERTCRIAVEGNDPEKIQKSEYIN